MGENWNIRRKHLTHRCRTWHLTCTSSGARTTAARDPMLNSQRSEPLDHGDPLLWKILVANSVDPDQTPHYVASDLGLHCLSMILLRVSRVSENDYFFLMGSSSPTPIPFFFFWPLFFFFFFLGPFFLTSFFYDDYNKISNFKITRKERKNSSLLATSPYSEKNQK